MIDYSNVDINSDISIDMFDNSMVLIIVKHSNDSNNKRASTGGGGFRL